MAQVIVTMKIMPTSPETDLGALEEKASKLINEFGGEIGKSEQEPIAFGLKSLKLMFVMNEDLGSTESLENDVGQIEGVNSVEVIDVRRAVG
ncbi:MAG: elongation factor 1-beta [Candidatus Woesearchaeota archaeon]